MVEGSASRVSTARPKRWLRFTLRVLFAGITVLCVVLAIWTHRARRQQAIVQRILRGGGQIAYEFDIEDGCYFQLPRRESPLPVWLLKTLGHDYFHRVKAVEILDDLDVIADLSLLPDVEQLFVGNESANDESLRPIRDIRSLKWVLLGRRLGAERSPAIGDRTLQVLASLPALEAVWIEGRGLFSMDGLSALATAPSLNYAEVSGCSPAVDRDAATEIFYRRGIRGISISVIERETE